MQQQIHITPDQIPQLLAQNREQLLAVSCVVDNKVKAMELLGEMHTQLMDGNTRDALMAFVEIQRIEYTQQLHALHMQQSQIQSLIHQLENPVSIPTLNVGAMPPPPGSKGNGPFNPPRR
jgi:hypothetical protein